MKTLEYTFERSIDAPPDRAYAAWLDPKTIGSPWHEADQLILNPTRDGFFYLRHGQWPHYGRFTRVERSRRIQHTWVSRNTNGEESTVTVTFKKSGSGTLMALRHDHLPNTPGGRAHEEGWNHYLDIFSDTLKQRRSHPSASRRGR